jgi:hypothetical protein
MFKYVFLVFALCVLGFAGFVAFTTPDVTQTEITKDVEVVDNPP